MYTYEYSRYGPTLEIFKDGESIYFLKEDDAEELDNELGRTLQADRDNPGEIDLVQLILSGYDLEF